MSSTVDIRVHHLTRVEGHGNILVRAADGRIEEVVWQVPEAPRFFEAMVRGHSYEDIQTIVSRVCGICSISHSLASVKATEAAMDIEVSPQTQKLRLLIHYSEQLQSHILHVGYLVAPDLFNAPSVIPLIDTHTDAVLAIVRVHRAANEWSELLGGRITHPVTLCPGGFTRLPTAEQLKELDAKLEAALADVRAVADVVLSVADRLPAFRRETEYVAQVEPGHYTFYDGEIGSTDADPVPVSEYRSAANERVSPQSTAKWTRWHRDCYAVGALARFNLNAEHLLPEAADVAARFALAKGCANPFMNSVAQLVECVQVLVEARGIIDELLSDGLQDDARRPVTPKAGQGVGCVEAPRGILFHDYTYDDRGRCTGANLVIPTNQNHANIQKDFEAFVPEFLDRGQDELRLLLEMLVRSYDPCISCSTHYLTVQFT
ncbi:MAG: Ni/Fe hydrogenase subunit alpha [Candidatus Brocadiaceae bacterium]|nr:Ni/Fe hydrogenase subunit alpha [Candidatus Brocadiaceae bacterium]